MTTTSSISLHELPARAGEVEGTGQEIDGLQNPNHGPEFSLPPVDGGKEAWLFLAACFLIEALIWGFPFSFGVFQEYYSTHEPFSSDPSGIAVIGTTATGIMYMLAVPLAAAYNKWPWLANASKWAGIPLMASGLVAASFATNVKALVMTQGVLYALGGAIVYSPALIFLDQWFIRRKGFAFGIVWAGTGVGGLTIPFIMNSLLGRFGFRTTLRIWGVTNLALASPFIYFLRPRLPIGPITHSPRRGLNFLRTSTFWVLLVGLTAESLGYFIPGIYLPSFARALGFSPAIGTLLVALINAAGVSGTVFMGWLIDRFHVATIVLICSVGAAASVFLGWGFSNALPLLCVFSLLYGFFAGGYVSTNAGFLKIIKQKDQSTDVGALLGMLSAGRGLGALVSGPLSEALLKGSPWKGEAEFGYGSGFGSLIVFTGVTATVGAVGFLGRRVGWV